MSPKLSKAYRKAGYKVVFKSKKNLQTILTSKNKSKLPKNSFPGVYKIPCSCGIIPYRGETQMEVSTRSVQHKTDIQRGRWENSAVAAHLKICNGEIQFEKTSTAKVIYNRFDRKVRESLEIQKNDCNSQNGMNLDNGQYVTTKFWTPFFKHLRNMNDCRQQYSVFKKEDNILLALVIIFSLYYLYNSFDILSEGCR